VPAAWPRLQIFPAEDVAFRRYVLAAVESMRAIAAGRQSARPPRRMDPQDLQWRLREQYPAAVVRERDSLADPEPDERLWYVYRFGSVTPGRRWWEEPGHAWAVLDDGRCFVEVSTSLTEIAEVSADDLRGRPIEAFSNPDDVSARDDVAALWAVLGEGGVLHSTLRFRHRDGTPREIEYHVTRDGAGPGRHLAVVREIDAT
jgi:PAS domain S-box-containing protein